MAAAGEDRCSRREGHAWRSTESEKKKRMMMKEKETKNEEEEEEEEEEEKRQEMRRKEEGKVQSWQWWIGLQVSARVLEYCQATAVSGAALNSGAAVELSWKPAVEFQSRCRLAGSRLGTHDSRTRASEDAAQRESRSRAEQSRAEQSRAKPGRTGRQGAALHYLPLPTTTVIHTCTAQPSPHIHASFLIAANLA
ncbi:hypothetical protein CCMA1212_001222 [Trichoderma ghanense]|uniref:Uncharacterized protein n=1 Tax=Trichoderma ghanense TaxID=65468 RepID=A0ABY2HJ57_9HYPO